MENRLRICQCWMTQGWTWPAIPTAPTSRAITKGASILPGRAASTRDVAWTSGSCQSVYWGAVVEAGATTSPYRQGSHIGGPQRCCLFFKRRLAIAGAASILPWVLDHGLPAAGAVSQPFAATSSACAARPPGQVRVAGAGLGLQKSANTRKSAKSLGSVSGCGA